MLKYLVLKCCLGAFDLMFKLLDYLLVVFGLNDDSSSQHDLLDISFIFPMTCSMK